MKPEQPIGPGPFRQRRLARVLSLCGVLLPACLLGCASRESRFHVVAFKNPQLEERYAQVFPEGAFAFDAGNRCEIVFERHDESLPADHAASLPDAEDSPAPYEAAGEEAVGQEALGEEAVELRQFVSITVLWRPRPGKTFVERTQTNAVISYCLLRGDHVISYEGGGFVYFSMSRDGTSISGSVESSTLNPTRSAGQTDDYFGPCHLSGDFRARLDKRQVVSVYRRMRRILGPPITSVNSEPVAGSNLGP